MDASEHAGFTKIRILVSGYADQFLTRWSKSGRTEKSNDVFIILANYLCLIFFPISARRWTNEDKGLGILQMCKGVAALSEVNYANGILDVLSRSFMSFTAKQTLVS